MRHVRDVQRRMSNIVESNETPLESSLRCHNYDDGVNVIKHFYVLKDTTKVYA